MQLVFEPGATLTGSGQVGTNESPMGNGCVAAVSMRGSCGAGFSSMPMSGLPFGAMRRKLFKSYV
jgi:hypothetical protein